MNAALRQTMSEGDLQKSTLDLAQTLGWRIARFPAANFVRTKEGREFVRPLAHDTKGFPDCLLVRGRLVAVEFKAEGKAQTIEQSDWHRWLLAADVEMHVWRPEQWLDGTIEMVLNR